MRWFLLSFLVTYPILAADAPVPPKDAVSKFKLPLGFKATLFAGEPDVVQPIAFTFDDRGRMWVVECMMYPKWSQDGKGGKDRVVILEDTNGDGTFDKKTVVIDNGVNLSGIEWGFGGIYLCASPYLIHVPIDANDKPGKQEILLDGWNIKDTKHNIFNSLIWGPDGWLYGCNGIQTKSYVGKPDTPKDKRIFFDCGVWRFHPTKKVFEVVANGTTNPFGLDFDENGEMFITNCVIDHLFHIVPGGHYTRMYGNDPNPYVYGYMGSCVDYKHWGSGAWTDSRADQKTGALKKEHDDAGGGHAHSGCMIYQAENFPKEYRNTLFTCNIHGNRLNNDGLERTKTGMKGVRRPDFLFANDPWFRGICVKQGPAGELFVSDWSDTGECHNYQVVDASNGRIFRVTYGDLKPFSGDVSKMTNEELIKLVPSKNEWLSRKARRILQERCSRDPKGSAALADAIRKEYEASVDTHSKLRYLWALYFTGLAQEELLSLIPYKEEETLSLWAIRLAGDHAYAEKRSAFELLRAIYKCSPNPRLQHALANELRKHSNAIQNYLKGLPPESGGIDELLQYALLQYEADRNTQLMFWYAVEASGMDLQRLVKIRSNNPLLYEYTIRKMFAAQDQTTTIDTALKLLSEMPADECRVSALRGIADSLRGSKSLNVSKTWQQVYAQFLDTKSLELRNQLDEIGLILGDGLAIGFLKSRAADVRQRADERARAISLLAGRKVTGFDNELRKLLNDGTVRHFAIIGLANYNDANTPKLILDIYGKLTPEEKADAVTTLASRGAYATALLDAVEKGTIPKTDITAFTARQIAALKDKDVVAKLEKVWGKVQPASANRKALMDKYKAILTPDSLASADASKGKAVFVKNCATCHKMFGEGQNVGPELTGSQRSNLDYILENVVDPSAVVAKEYQMTNYYLLDGRIVSGIVKQDTPNSVTVRTVNEEVVIPKADIESKKATTLSVMPEGLLDVLKPEDVRNLVKYLMSKEQVK